MSDRRRRGLERLASRGDPEAEAAVFVAALREGSVFREQGALLASLGDPAAGAVLGRDEHAPFSLLSYPQAMRDAGPMFAALACHALLGDARNVITETALHIGGPRLEARAYMASVRFPLIEWIGGRRTLTHEEWLRIEITAQPAYMESEADTVSHSIQIARHVARVMALIALDPTGQERHPALGSWPDQFVNVWWYAQGGRCALWDKRWNLWGRGQDPTHASVVKHLAKVILDTVKPWVMSQGPSTWPKKETRPERAGEPNVARKKTKKKTKARRKKTKKKTKGKARLIVDDYGNGIFEICALDKDGDECGCLRVNAGSNATLPGCGKIATISWVGVSTACRREGLATRMYAKAKAIAQKCGRLLASDTRLRPGSRGFWEKQVEKGRARKIGRRYVLGCKTKSLKNPREVHAYRVWHTKGDRELLGMVAATSKVAAKRAANARWGMPLSHYRVEVYGTADVDRNALGLFGYDPDAEASRNARERASGQEELFNPAPGWPDVTASVKPGNKHATWDQGTPALVLVACSKTKLGHAAPAKDLYSSPLFRLSRAYAESTGLPWAILSAKHGLVLPDQVLAPYDLYLPKLDVDERFAWSSRVKSQLRVQFPGVTHMVSLAGGLYTSLLETTGCPSLSDLGISVEHPMKGLQVGERLRWLKAAAAGQQPRELGEQQTLWNPAPPIHPQALVDRERYYDDLEAGHTDAAEYWRGSAGAYFTANPPHDSSCRCPHCEKQGVIGIFRQQATRPGGVLPMFPGAEPVQAYKPTEVACPYCHAPVGRPCKKPGQAGAPRKAHTKRVHAVSVLNADMKISGRLAAEHLGFDPPTQNPPDALLRRQGTPPQSAEVTELRLPEFHDTDYYHPTLIVVGLRLPSGGTLRLELGQPAVWAILSAMGVASADPLLDPQGAYGVVVSGLKEAYGRKATAKRGARGRVQGAVISVQIRPGPELRLRIAMRAGPDLFVAISGRSADRLLRMAQGERLDAYHLPPPGDQFGFLWKNPASLDADACVCPSGWGLEPRHSGRRSNPPLRLHLRSV